MRKRPNRASQRIQEEAPREAEKRQLAEQWLADNQQAIAAYNEFVEAHGVWSDQDFASSSNAPR